MKKVFAIVLTLTMLLCSTIVTAGAFTFFPQYEIAVGDTVRAEIPDSKVFSFAMVSFIPEESGAYELRSYAGYESDPYCYLFDGSNAELLAISDDEYGTDFCLSYYFEAGKLYYFAIYDYDKAAQFDISLSCAHSYTDGICEYCSEECSHEFISENFGFCKCGKVFTGIDVAEGKISGLMFGENCEKNLRFTPEEDGAYIISSSSAVEKADIAADVYDEEFMYFDYGDDENGLQFIIINEFEAGKTYYIDVYNYSDFDYKFDITVEKAVHNVTGGGKHKLTYVQEVYPDCITEGYTEGLYCSQCEEYVYGHEVLPLEEHFDWDRNGECDVCGEETELPDCFHICHNESRVLSFIWKITNFFNRLLGINPLCECGVFHW